MTALDPDENREDAARRLTERFALLLTNAGMPRMPARAFGALLVADSGRRSAPELAEFLQVSPAAISGAVRYLVQVEMAERVREPGERRDQYALYGGTWYEAVTRKDRTLDAFHQVMADGAEALGMDTPAGQRLAESAAFFDYLADEMSAVLKRWHERQSG
ncbi:MAG TPA: MarR family transcriptional regulator [Pseudonocardiaceae bacterium]